MRVSDLRCSFTNEELSKTILRKVKVHIGERSTTVMMGVMTIGYTLNDYCELSTAKPSSFVYDSPKINVAQIHLARVGEDFYQVLLDGATYNLYLPSPVDDDNSVWKNDK